MSELFLHLIVGCVIIVRWWLGDGPIVGSYIFDTLKKISHFVVFIFA